MEMDRVYLMALVAATIEATVCLVGTRELWRSLSGGKDRSRRLLILGAFTSGFLALVPIFVAAGAVPEQSDFTLLHPWIVMIYMSLHIVMTLYPIAVISPGWFNFKRYFLVFLPMTVSIISLIFIGDNWTRIYNHLEIWENVKKFDVLLRVGMLFIMAPYCLILFAVNYNYRKTSASFGWIVNYSVGLSLLCGVHILYMLSGDSRLLIVLPILASIFYLWSIEFELKDRLEPDEAVADIPETVPEDLPAEFGLWTRICIVMDQEEAWRDPDLSLGDLAKRCGTNTTYLNQIIHGETGTNFKTFINTKRVDFVTKQLREHPGLDIQTAFFDAGYRSRTTAWRNFKEIVGETPTEFRQKLFP